MPKSPLLTKSAKSSDCPCSIRTEEAYLDWIKQASELEARWNVAFVVTCIVPPLQCAGRAKRPGVPSGAEQGPRPSISAGVPYPLGWKTTALSFKNTAGKIQSGVALRLATALHKTARHVTFSAASSWV
ncbi:MAG: hypothetical protein M3Q91_06620 [Acidobacteriota bacterium]|nr:hypothetical protein [Acidobacteriota bacterium]